MSDEAAVLLLFDIDGTLVTGATVAHRDAMRVALLEVHGVDAGAARGRSGPTAAGRTDGEISREILLAAGVSAERIDDRADEVRERCCRAYAKLCPEDLSHTVIPGMQALLGDLAAREEVRLGLLTGNFEPIARLKLRRAGIGHYFPARQGAFGSDSEDRAALPAIARRRAGARGDPYPRERTVVIGDTPRDIACARADGLRCVAIATGPYGVEELSGADAVAADASELGAVVDGL